MDRSFVLQAWLVVLWLLSPAVGQVEIDITHSYPFTTAHTVVSDQNGASPIIYEGSGGGVFVLDGADLTPSLKSGVGNQLRAGGLVRDLALTDDHLYAAAHRGGLVRFRRDSTNNDVEWQMETDEPLDDTHPWAVVVPIQIGGDDLVFVGTNDDYYDFDSASGGSLHLIRADASLVTPDPPEHEDTIDLGAPVHSLATMIDGNQLTLLVGTACREVGGAHASVLRYDFDISSGLPVSFPLSGPTATWSPTVGGNTVPTFVRDIVIDADEQYAYVAAYTRGVFKLDISSGLTTASGNWPIMAGANTRSQFNALALYDGPLGHVLAVGAGPRFHEETTVWGPCSEVAPCDDVDPELAQRFGLTLFDISSTNPLKIGSLSRSDLKPLGLAIHELDGSLVIATASNVHGLVMVQATPDGSDFELSAQGAWNIDDGVSTSQHDDLLVLGNSAFVAFEKGLTAFDVTEVCGGPASDLFSTPVDVAAGGAVVLAGVEADSGFPTMVFASNLTLGVVFYEIEGDGPTTEIRNRGSLPGTEPGPPPEVLARTYSVAALGPSETPDGYPWLIVINASDEATEGEECDEAQNGTVRVFRIMLNGSGQLDPDTAVELGAYAPYGCTLATGSLVGGHAVRTGTDTISVLVGYSPAGRSAQPIEPDAGLLFLSFEYTGNDSVVVTSANKVPAFEDGVEGNTALIRHVSHGLIMAALGCNGVATFSMAESLLSRFPATGTSPTSFMDCAPGPDSNVYATALDGRIWVFDPTDMTTPLAIVETHDKGAFLEPAATTGSGSPPPAAFFTTDFRGGLHRVQFLSTP